MIFYREMGGYASCYQPYYSPCQPQAGYGSGLGYSREVNCYDPCNRYGYGYGYGYGYQPYGYNYGSGMSSLPPISYGCRYSDRGSCYVPDPYRMGFGARRNFPSRRCIDPCPW